MRPDFDGVQVFSATKYRERAELGEVITDWLQDADVEPVDVDVTQSSDDDYHCLTVVVWYRRR